MNAGPIWPHLLALVTVLLLAGGQLLFKTVARAINGDSFVEVYVKCDLDVCETRDPKGLYKKARAGQIPEFTGISAPYEAPENAELVIDTGVVSLEESAAQVVAFLEKRGVFTV